MGGNRSRPRGLPTLPYRATASAGGVTLADSRATLRQDRDDAAPRLWFPCTDVDAAALGGLAATSWWEGTGDLANHVAFDHEAVELWVVDGRPGDADRDVTRKRFPTWGDAADLIEVLDVHPDAAGRSTTVPRSDWRRPVVEGSQILGQAVVAVGRHAPGRRVVAASMVFPRAADAREPYVIELTPVAEGRTFSAMTVRADQAGRSCGVGTVLADATAPDVIAHAVAAPEVAGPYASTPHDMSVTGRDLRIVDDAYTGDPGAPVGPPELSCWVRFRDVPDDQALHAGLLAQFTGHLSIAAALRPHAGVGQAQAHHTLSTAINAISLSIHTEVRADRWMLYHHRSTHAGAGMTHSECRVHDEEGGLAASFTVDAMVRGIADPSTPLDRRTAL